MVALGPAGRTCLKFMEEVLVPHVPSSCVQMAISYRLLNAARAFGRDVKEPSAKKEKAATLWQDRSSRLFCLGHTSWPFEMRTVITSSSFEAKLRRGGCREPPHVTCGAG